MGVNCAAEWRPTSSSRSFLKAAIEPFRVLGIIQELYSEKQYMVENAVSTPLTISPEDLAAFWMPFTPNRHFKANPRMLTAAEGMYYTTSDGRKLLDGIAGLWCVNAGHGRREIAEAVHP